MYALLATVLFASTPAVAAAPAPSRLEQLLSSLSGKHAHLRPAPKLTTVAGGGLLWGGLRSALDTQLLTSGQTELGWRVYLQREVQLSAIPVVGPLAKLTGDALSSTERMAFGLALGAQLGGAALLAASLFDFELARQSNEGLRFTSMSVAADGFGATVRVGGTF